MAYLLLNYRDIYENFATAVHRHCFNATYALINQYLCMIPSGGFQSLSDSCFSKSIGAHLFKTILEAIERLRIDSSFSIEQVMHRSRLEISGLDLRRRENFVVKVCIGDKGLHRLVV